MGFSVLFYRALNRRGTPRRRGPAKILDIDYARVPVKFQSQTFKAARYCVRKKMGVQDAAEVDWNPASWGRILGMACLRWSRGGLRKMVVCLRSGVRILQ